LGFSFFKIFRAVEHSARTMRIGKKIRKRFSAVCALALISIFPLSASARQDSAGDASTKTPATPKKTTGTTATKSSSSSATSHRTASATHSASRRRSSRKKSARARGQQKIDSERAEAIQEALIREHYLTGTPTGTWNQASEDAMRKYQADNGWQSKTVPDSRALIKLGLGPSKDKLLNPDSAMTTVPDAPKAEAVPSTPHNAAPAAEPASPAVPPSTPAQSDPSRPQ
jgi:hypothetical protein